MTIVREEPALSQRTSGEERFLITDISWDFYVRFCDEIGERPLRLSYNNGMLEIMITKSPHEFYKTMLAKLIETIILELDIPVRSGGAMTFQRFDLEKGFEPDECWWITRESEVRASGSLIFKRTRLLTWRSKSRSAVAWSIALAFSRRWASRNCGGTTVASCDSAFCKRTARIRTKGRVAPSRS